MSYVKDSDGRWHTIFDQTKGSSCGPTCMRMVVKMMQNRDLGEEQARQLVERKNGVAMLSTLTSENGGVGQMGSHNWGNHGHHASGGGGVGVGAEPLAAALKGTGIKDAHVPQIYARQALLKTSLKNPGSAAVGWGGQWNGKRAQGAHWIVVAGQLSNGNILVLDPIYGIGEIDLSPAIPKYRPANHEATLYNKNVVLTAK